MTSLSIWLHFVQRLVTVYSCLLTSGFPPCEVCVLTLHPRVRPGQSVSCRKEAGGFIFINYFFFRNSRHLWMWMRKFRKRSSLNCWIIFQNIRSERVIRVLRWERVCRKTGGKWRQRHTFWRFFSCFYDHYTVLYLFLQVEGIQRKCLQLFAKDYKFTVGRSTVPFWDDILCKVDLALKFFLTARNSFFIFAKALCCLLVDDF